MIKLPQAPLFGLAAIALWSTNAPVAKWIFQYYPVSYVQLLQFIGALSVFICMHKLNKKKAQGRISLKVILIGLLGLVGTMIFQYLAFAMAPILAANLIAYCWPLILAFMFIIAGTSNSPWILALCSVAGFIGVSMIINTGNEVISYNDWLGYMCALLSAICMASYSFLIGRYHVSSAQVLIPAACIGMIIAGVWVAWEGVSLKLSPLIFAGLYLGAGPMGLGFLFWSIAMRKDLSGRTSLLGYLTPVTSTFLLWLFGETLGLYSILGACLVFLSCIIVGVSSGRSEKSTQPTTL